MTDNPGDAVLRQQVRDAAREARQADASWATSQVLARRYLAARERQLDVLQQVKAIRPGFQKIDDYIESVASTITRIKREIPALPPSGPADHYYTMPGGYARTTEPDRAPRREPISETLTRSPAPSFWRRHRPVLIGTVLAVAAAVMVSVVLFTRSSPPQPPPIGFIAAGRGGSLAEETPSGQLVLWDIAARHVAAALADPDGAGIAAIASSGNGTEIAIEDSNGSTYVWNIAERRIAAAVSTPEYNYTNSVALSADGKTLAEAEGNDQQVAVWDIATRRAVATIQVLPSSSDGSPFVDGIALSPNGKLLAVSLSVSGQPGVEIWNIPARQIASELSSDYGGDQLTFSPSGRTLITADAGTFTLWGVLNGVLTKTMTLDDPTAVQALSSNPAVSYAVFNPAGTTLATADGSSSGDIFLWNPGTGRIAVTLTDPGSQGVAGLAYTPDGKTLIAADDNGRIYLWDIATRKISATLTMSRR
jgi:sugar lactone lactonase YvrE